MKSLDLIVIPVQDPKQEPNLPHLNLAAYPRQHERRGVPPLDEAAFDQWILTQITPVVLSMAQSHFAIGIGTETDHPLERLRPEGARISDPALTEEAAQATVFGHLRKIIKSAIALTLEGPSSMGVHANSLRSHIPNQELSTENIFKLMHRLALDQAGEYKGLRGLHKLAEEMDISTLNNLYKGAEILDHKDLDWIASGATRKTLGALLKLVDDGGINAYHGRDGLGKLTHVKLKLPSANQGACAGIIKALDPELFKSLNWNFRS